MNNTTTPTMPPKPSPVIASEMLTHAQQEERLRIARVRFDAAEIRCRAADARYLAHYYLNEPRAASRKKYDSTCKAKAAKKSAMADLLYAHADLVLAQAGL